jgi:menaquinone-dependent protoporphyrinogen oxidase
MARLEAWMNQPVLVAFATRHGSTATTANATAEALRNCGVVVELLPVKDVTALSRYDAVVLGAALYIGRLHKDARRFLTAECNALSKMPVALFVPGPVEKREKDFVGARRQLVKELAGYPWLKPIACEVVGGTFDPNKMGFPFNLIPAMRKMPPSDARDWTAIDKWARKVAATLQAGAPITRETYQQPATVHN